MIEIISGSVLLLLLFTAVSLNKALRNDLIEKESENDKLFDELSELKLKHPECDKCHGKGLTIIGHEVMEYGVIWKQDGTKCKVCKGKGTL